MSQSRKDSLKETLTSITIGFVISLVAGWILYPLHGAPFTFATNFYITVEFTLISIARGYLVRRWFNRKAST